MKYTKYDQAVVWDMSFLEAVGAIFVRSQLTEQIMRELILASGSFTEPADFDKKTFGWLLTELAKLYPTIKDNDVPDEWKEHVDLSVYANLEAARDVRNSAAHGEYLAHISIKDLMPGKHADGIDRLTMKTMRKSVIIMDDALIAIWNFGASQQIPRDS